MRYVYRYEIQGSGDLVSLPEGAEILHFAVRSHELMFWALVDPSKPTEVRRFHVIGTGHPIPGDFKCEHVASTVAEPFVWHLFEERR